jgi:pyruvate,water dikinase
MARRFREFETRDLERLGERQLVRESDRLYGLTQETAYLNIVTPLLMLAYNRLLRRQLDRIGVAFDEFDLTHGLDELKELEPAAHLHRLHRQFTELDPALQKRVRRCNYEEFCRLPGLEPLQQGVAGFLRLFGHLSDSGNDFSYVPWRENPDLILDMVANYTPPPSDSSAKTRFEALQVSGARRGLLKWVYSRARSFRLHRESVSSLYTYGYGLFRNYYLALADRLVQRGILSKREDLFYLTAAEVREIVETARDRAWAKRLIGDRKREINRVREITPPSIIYGDEEPALSEELGDELIGVPTSRGQYTGPVKVLRGLQDFPRLERGDVLVIPYSDVSWTPLFAKAGAVVAEAGGILSHSSIVAREYGIPAVVSVPGACQLSDGIQVTVDGYLGKVTVRGSRLPS